MEIILDKFPRQFVHTVRKSKKIRRVDIPQEDGQISVFMLKKHVRLKPNTEKCKLIFDSEKDVLVHKNKEKIKMTPIEIINSYHRNIQNWRDNMLSDAADRVESESNIAIEPQQ